MAYTEEHLKKHPEYLRRQFNGETIIVNTETIGDATDEIYFELCAGPRFRKLKRTDGRAAFEPSGMTLYAWIDKDIGLFGVYAIDERVRFNLNRDFNLHELLTTPPQSWSSALRQAAQVSEFGNIRQTVQIPFVAFEK